MVTVSRLVTVYCNKGVGSKSLQCTICQKWVHKKCNGIKGSMSKVAVIHLQRLLEPGNYTVSQKNKTPNS